MENKKFTKLAALILSFAAVYSGMGCLMTAMGFWQVPMFPVAAAIALAAALTVFTAEKKWFPAIPAAFLLLCVRLWRKGPLEISLEAFLGRISFLYHSGYGWGIIRWTDEVLLPNSSQLALCLLGAWLAIAIGWSFLRCKGTLLPLLFTCLPVIPCMLLIDTVPESLYLFGICAVISLLLLIRIPKKQSQGVSVLRMLTIPTVLAVLVLFLCLPQKSYEKLPFMEDIFSFAHGLFTGTGQDPPDTPVREEGSWVNLSTVGPKTHRRGTVMEVTVNHAGYLYLKGYAYDTYYGTWWDSKYTSPAVTMPPSTSRRTVRVTTKAMHDVLYLPYGFYGIGYAYNPITVSEQKGHFENIGPWRSYNAKYRVQPSYADSWQQPSQDAPEAYTQLSKATREQAERYLNQHLPALSAMGVWDKANAIVKHVSESAKYSLNTEKMPIDTKDFALWFLENSDTGYCIHFASAAAVLLRAANIPCRYVTGYLVYAQANRATEVENKDAHAWVEMYIDGVGWIPLEATPSDGISQPPTDPPASTEDTMQTEASAEVTTEATGQASTETTGGETTPTTNPPTQATQDTAPPERLPSHITEKPDISPNGGVDEPQPQDLTWLKWAASLLGSTALIILQWRLRVWLRIKKRQKGKRSAQALHRWQEVVLHSRVRKEPPNERLHQLAQKAKFSHHAITREELGEFDTWLHASKTIIRHSNLWQRFLATFIYALY